MAVRDEGTAESFDIFISHNSRDKSLIDPIVQRLYEEHEIRAWVDQWELHAAEEWEPAILSALKSCRVAAVVLGANGWGDYHLREARLAIDQRRTHPDFRVIPVLLPGVNDADAGVLADFFTRTHRVDFTNGAADDEAFRRLLAAIRGEAPGPPPMTVFAVNRAARQWHQSPLQEKPSILFRGGELRRAQQITATHTAMLSDEAVRFLAASAEAEQQSVLRERRRTRWTIVALTVGILLLAGATLYALRQRAAEQKARIEATRQRDIARSRELASRGESELIVDPAASLFHALAATRVAMTAEAELMLRRAIATSKVRVVMRGHVGAVTALAMNADASLIATGGRDGTARVWNPKTGKELFVLTSGGEGIESIAFSPAGNVLATFDAKGDIRLWDSKSGSAVGGPCRPGGGAGVGGETRLSFSGDGRTLFAAISSRVYSIAVKDGRSRLELRPDGTFVTARFSPDGALILTSGEGAQPTLWDARTGRRRAVLGGYTMFESRTFAIFSPDGSLAVTAGSGDLQVWRTATGKRLFKLEGPGAWGRFDAAFTRDGRWVVTGGTNAFVKVWDLYNGMPNATVPEPGVTAVRLSRDDRFIMTAGGDGVARIWHRVTGALVAELRGHTEEITAAEFLPDGVSVVTASADGTTRIWSALADQRPVTLPGQEGGFTRAVFSPAGDVVLTAGRDKTARVWDAASGRLLTVLSGHEAALTDACFIPRRGLIATAAADGEARLWEARTGRLRTILRGHRGTLTSVAADARGDRVVTAGVDGTARIWSVPAGAELRVLEGHRAGVNQARFSPDGMQVVTASDDHTSRIWDAGSGKTLHVLAGQRQILAAFSPDGRSVLTHYNEDGPSLWDARTGRLIGALPEAAPDVEQPSFSSDGKWIVARHRGGSVRLWSTGPLRPAGAFADAEGQFGTFSSDTRFVATSGEGGVTRVWEVATGRNLLTFFSEEYVSSVSFSPDATRVLVQTSNDVRIYTCEPCRSIESLSGLASRRLAATHASRPPAR